VHRTIPNLDKVADRLSAVQQEFLLKAVSITAPLGTWRREKSEGIAYLKAEDVADRLKGKPRELGLDRLIAFTGFALRDEDNENLIVWNNDKDICIFSTYELIDQIRPPLSLERLVANAVAWYGSGLPAHERGTKDCPAYYNAELDINYVAGPLKLCRVCLNKLKKKPELRHAIEQLLGAYP
jgi:hypothetical protein